MSIISVQQADQYEQDAMKRAIDAHFSMLGIEKDMRPGLKVLIKPNLVTARRPEQSVTTHPALLMAICAWLRERGVCEITIADSPGGPHMTANLKTVYNLSGMTQLSAAASLNMDTGYSAVQCPAGFMNRSFNIINPILEADYIINVAKLKTHGMTILSAGIKNLFGAIPGLQKPELHYRFPDPKDFVRMLLEVAQTVKPQVTVLDAVDAMEGNGPNSGTTRHMGLTFASRDMYAQDWAACALMGIDPQSVPMLSLARDMGLLQPEEIKLTGFTPAVSDPPFKLPDSIDYDLLKKLPGFLRRPLSPVVTRLLKPVPEVNVEKCIGCGKCAESCPSKIIVIHNGKACISRKNCISCFCCQEMCPVHAIGVKRKIKR
jgi:uncharacterized protein (DUF362 family)/ferredoxin